MKDTGDLVEIQLEASCHAEDSVWLYGMQSEIASHFNITQQRIEVSQCRDDHTVIVNVLEPQESWATPSSKLADEMVERLSGDPDYIGSEFNVKGARHTHATNGTANDGIVGLWIALTVLAVCCAISGTAGYIKRDAVHSYYRRAKRKVRGWTQHNDDDDYDNEGHTYDADDQGGMHVSKTETTYELDGVSNEDPEPDRGPDTTIQTRYVPSPTGGAVYGSPGIQGGIPASNY